MCSFGWFGLKDKKYIKGFLRLQLYLEINLFALNRELDAVYIN